MSKNLLLEIGTEEMPANIMSGVVKQLEELVAHTFAEARISFEKAEVYATPRRLAVIITGAADRQPDEEIKKRGPSIKAAYDENGNLTKAAAGFARGQQVNPEDLIKEGDYVWAEVVHKGEAVEDILPTLFTSFITGLTFTRSMRWGNEEARFIRPIRWIVALCGTKVIPMEFAHVKSGNTSRGHRFLCKEPVTITAPEEYKEIMRQAFVIVDQEERRTLIAEGLMKTAKELGGTVWHNEDLLEEINYLVEYPTPLHGRIDEKFLQLPVPAVVTPMRDHQRYYPVRKEDGSLLPYFLTVRNGGDKAIKNVQTGNERVLRARLEDAKFFFDGDRKKSLEGHRDALKRINYQEGMGTLWDKAERLEKMVTTMAQDWGLTEEETKKAQRSAYLSKSDLATGMVTEFTELQGEMGKEYALLDGEDKDVAEAIFEQYMPRFAGDRLPALSIGRALSLADKLDNIAATFLRGLIPTGSQDPFALRRQTIGIVNILTDGHIHWDIRRGIKAALALLPGSEAEKKETALKIEDFIRQRMRIILLDKGIDYDILDAVLAGTIDDIYALFLKAQGMVENHVKEEEELRQAITRMTNLTKDKIATAIRPDFFEQKEENDLYDALQQFRPAIQKAYDKFDYTDAFTGLKKLTAPIHAYLDAVMVMVDDEAVKTNRISLLTEVLSLYKQWGDFSRLV